MTPSSRTFQEGNRAGPTDDAGPPRLRCSTPFAGMTRIRFEGLRSPALSAPRWRSPVASAEGTPDAFVLHRSEGLGSPGGGSHSRPPGGTCQGWGVLLRLL